MTQENFRYVILGAGRQGTAAAYDLALFGGAAQIVMADVDGEVAQRSAERINRLVGREVATSRVVDVTDSAMLRDVLEGATGVISAVPYYYNLDITRAAIAVRAHLSDLGGNSAVVRSQLALDAEAKEAGISIVPDCGMGPGLITTFIAYLVELLDEPREVIVYDGGLPQNPIPPWNYQITFHINGLTNEYHGQATFIRDGKLVKLESFSEMRMVNIPRMGTLEAFVAADGIVTAAHTYLGKLQRLENWIVRYPGHYEWFKAFKTLGLFGEEPIRVGDQMVVPREVFHALLEPQIRAPLIEDVCILRGEGWGKKDGREVLITIDLLDYYDPQTGFTAMERLTGWHSSTMMSFQVRGVVPPGAVSVENAVPGSLFMEAIRARGINYTVEIHPATTSS